jgi:hypothetical protein
MTPKKQRRRAMRQERELAEATGGRVQAGSGAVPGNKGDVRLRGKFRAECKYTKTKSYRVTRQDLDKITSEASFGEVPIFDITFVGSSGMTEDRWVLLPHADWLRLTAISINHGAPTVGVIHSSDFERLQKLARDQRAAGGNPFEILKWEAPVLCEHANENPMVCPCLDTCYCRTHTCKDK